MRRLLPCAALAVVCGCANLQGPPSLATNVLAGSGYVFRGVPFNEEPVLQLDATTWVRAGDDGMVSGTVWGNVDVRDSTGDAVLPDGNQGKFSEVDGIVDYARDFGDLAASVGVIHYGFPDSARSSTTEAYVGAVVEDVLGRPSLTAFYDLDEVNGLYLAAAATHGWSLDELTDVSVRVSLGLVDGEQAEALYGSDRSGLADLVGSVTLTRVRSESTRLRLTAAVSTIVDQGLANDLEATGVDADHAWVSLGFGWSL